MTDPEHPREEILTDDPRLEMREAVSDRLSSLWWTFVLRGTLAAIVGVAALFWPTGSISLLLQIIGALLLIDGLLTLFGGRGRPEQAIMGGAGIVTAIIGLVLIIWPEGTVRLTFWLIGAWAILGGITALITSGRMSDGDPERGSVRNGGIVAVVAGLVLIFWPGTGVVALGWAIALGALLLAAALFFMASRLKRANDRVKMRSVN